MKSFFSYFGSKVRLAKYYPEPKYNFIIEPFAGSAGYSLRYPDRAVILFDIDPVIVGIWRYLIYSRPSEIMALPIEGSCIDDFHVCQEAKDLIGFWFGRSSTHPRTVRSPWSDSNPSAGWNANIRDRIASQVDHIKHWRVFQKSYLDIGPFWGTWFVDPPYQAEGSKYRHHNINYAELGTWCRQLKGQVLVCESAGANWLPFEPLGSFRNTTKNSSELLYHQNS